MSVHHLPKPKARSSAKTKTDYAELAAFSNFTFLRGASHPAEIVEAAAALGHHAVAVTDINSLAGIVRAHVAAKSAKIRLIVGARLVFADGTPDILAYPENRAAYSRLTQLLTLGNRRADKGSCILTLRDLLTHGEGLLLAALPGQRSTCATNAAIADLATGFPGQVWLAVAHGFGRDGGRHLARHAEMAAKLGVPLLAVGDVLMHDADRKALADVLTAIGEHVTVDNAGRLLEANAERHLKSPDEMKRLFSACPQAIAETLRLANRARFCLDELAYNYPDEVVAKGQTPQETLVRLTHEGAGWRYPEGVPDKVATALAHELQLIGELDYASYFLTVHDFVAFARNQDILCQGRGSAANSAVCFCLGITSVDPARIDLLFERFISAERGEPPDIDVDFEHERREEVIQYIYAKYGRARAGLAATVITYRARSALREVGKALGLSGDVVAALARTVWGISSAPVTGTHVIEAGLDPGEARLKMTMALSRQLIGFPRHLSQHVGGFVITKEKLTDLVPVHNAAMADRTVVEWDKDDLDALGFLKVDVLGLGMLSCIAKSFAMLREAYGLNLNLARVPAEEPEVYDMLCRADSVGVFQIESRAQMSMLPRLKPRSFYDLVVEVAIVRPGPIQGDMVHPYLRRRSGKEKIDYPSEELRAVLGKTLGIPLFQEQAMKIAIVAAGFTPSEADQLRRAMATFRKTGTIQTFRDKFVGGMVARGYETDFATRCFNQIEGFGEYGFPESHAASFALLVYVSSWLKCHYPDIFAAALLNSQPMGFYAPAQIVRDLTEHGCATRPVDISHSMWDCTLEPAVPGEPAPFDPARIRALHREMAGDIRTTHAVRLGFRQIKGLKKEAVERIVAKRGAGYDGVRDLWLRTGLAPSTLARLAEADVFRSVGLDRRAALWAVRGLGATSADDVLPLFAHARATGLGEDEEVTLPPMPLGEHVVHDYRTLRLSLKAHPLAFLRDKLAQRRYVPHEALAQVPQNAHVRIAGLVLARQRPGTAKGVIFATLEDETGVANLIVWPRAFEKYRRIVLGARLLGVAGKVRREGLVIHVIADKLVDLTPALALLSEDYADAGGRRQTSQLKYRRGAAARDILPKGRNFH
ncbi:Error-prone repair homolog of DNA polymerase III alpha subunit [hydrothermal vent metagenome]|uniref:Error-prone DNA polymerase n=1 Tax=hydrothermal vent metagenome TaxID=652676 RepID=A0A3B0UGQ4_9ZZZZ